MVTGNSEQDCRAMEIELSLISAAASRIMESLDIKDNALDASYILDNVNSIKRILKNLNQL